MKFIGNYKKRVGKNKLFYLPACYVKNIESNCLYGFTVKSNLLENGFAKYTKLVLREQLYAYIGNKAYQSMDLIVKQQNSIEYKILNKCKINIGISNTDIAVRGCGDYIEVIWENNDNIVW